MHLVLVRATPRAEVDVIGVQRCEIAKAIFPRAALPCADCSLSLRIVDDSSDRLVCWLYMDSQLMGSFLADKSTIRYSEPL